MNQSNVQVYLMTSIIPPSFFLIFSNLSISSLFGIGLFSFFCIKFFFDLGTKIEIRDLIIIIALLQWIIGPILAYEFNPDDQFYYMAVDEPTYMAFVVPATSLFITGLYLPIFKWENNEQNLLLRVAELLKKQPNIDIIFISIGTISQLTIDFFPSAIRFAIALISGARFIGLYLLIMNDRKYKWWIFGIVILSLFVSSLEYGMFHDLLLWLGFLFVIIAFIRKFSLARKITLSLAFFFSIFVIQSVKTEFRALLTKTSSSNIERTKAFTGVVQNKLGNIYAVIAKENLDAMINRINQGWIIARIMSWTPRYEPFAEGETIIKGIQASLLPRFLAPDKAKAGGREYFERFTGKFISKNTSMGLSPLGEAYANFGIVEGAIFMLLLGLFYNFILKKIFSYAATYPTLILFLPLIFLQVVKAEVDFAVVINYLIKAIIAVALLFWFSRNFLKLRL